MRIGREQRRRLNRLQQLDVFAECSDHELATIEHLGVHLHVAKGVRLVREGEIGKECFVIVDGRARVTRGGEDVAELGPGAVFGELALLGGRRRNADVTAETDMIALVFDPGEFATILADAPHVARAIENGAAARAGEAGEPTRAV